MKRALIIGCPGSGKTTFGKVLSQKTGLPLVHLDKLYPLDHWQRKISQEEVDRLIQAELDKPEWILDGNYNRTLPRRLEYCDTVFYFDLPTYICLWGAIERTIMNYGKTRDDVNGNCIEKFDRQKLRFFKFIIGFNREHRRNYTWLLNDTENVNVIIFKSRKEAEKYLRYYS